MSIGLTAKWTQYLPVMGADQDSNKWVTKMSPQILKHCHFQLPGLWSLESITLGVWGEVLWMKIMCPPLQDEVCCQDGWWSWIQIGRKQNSTGCSWCSSGHLTQQFRWKDMGLPLCAAYWLGCPVGQRDAWRYVGRTWRRQGWHFPQLRLSHCMRLKCGSGQLRTGGWWVFPGSYWIILGCEVRESGSVSYFLQFPGVLHLET